MPRQPEFQPSTTLFDVLHQKQADLVRAYSLAVQEEKWRRGAQEEAQTDPVTGLGNRRAFELAYAALPIGRLTHFQRRSHEQGHSLLLIDIDNFKLINDERGHPAGDFVLKRAAGVMVNLIRDGDVATRIGGDEFAILLPYADEEKACAIGERILHGVKTVVDVTLSIGVTTLLPGELDENLRRADVALYAAKDLGRDRVICHADLPAINRVED